jgi:hypothetical protein
MGACALLPYLSGVAGVSYTNGLAPPILRLALLLFLPDLLGLVPLGLPHRHPLDPPVGLRGEFGVGKVQEVAEVDVLEAVGDGALALVVELEEFQVQVFFCSVDSWFAFVSASTLS